MYYCFVLPLDLDFCVNFTPFALSRLLISPAERFSPRMIRTSLRYVLLIKLKRITKMLMRIVAIAARIKLPVPALMPIATAQKM